MPRVDLETALEEPEGEDDEEPDWGVERFDQFTWKELLDTYACTECARCTNHCPADATGKPLSPMEVIHQIRHEMLDRGSKMLRAAKAFGEKKKAIETDLEEMAPMVGKNALDDPSNGRMDDDTIWACTTCGACREVCPVFIEHPNAILRIRTNMVLAQEGRVPKQLADAFEGMERNMNPWGLGIDSRFDWAKGLDIPVLGELDDPEKVEWCFFIGCAGNYDNRMQKQAKAFSRVLDEAGVSYAVLGPEEVCCGDAARRAGHEYLFQMMAEQNIEKLEEYGVQKVVTACPHGYHTLKKEYPQMGGDLEVYHSSQLVSALIDEGKINLTGSLGSKIAVHDSCYLGRWNDIYEEPREIARAAAGKGGFVELPRARSRSFCCGGGGGRFWMEEETPRVNEDRAKEIISAGVDVVATACPFCTTMITDGLKAFDKEEEVEVIDIVEIADKLIKKEGDVEE
jgi:Fe-S oxidoreductase